jgi:transposase
MDKRIKYSIKQKQVAVRSILEGRESCRSAARELGCEKSAVCRWLKQYRQHGTAGFKIRNGSYEGAFRVRVVQYVMRKGISLPQAASHFNIPNESTIHCWIKIYEQQGAMGLLKDKRGGKVSTMPRKPRKSIVKPSDPTAQKLIELQKEVEYLRAENAFLKKLEALAQQEQAAKAQARRPKPSGN